MKELENRLTKLNYEFEEVADSIFLIKNFLTDDEIDSIMLEINAASQSEWETHYMEGVIGLAERKYGRTDIDNLVEEGLVEITTHWHDKNLRLSESIAHPISERVDQILKFDPNIRFDGIGTIQRQYEGAQLTEHVDNHADPEILYAAIMYINDDYVNGELFFSRLNFEIKPPSKSLLIFPSGEKYLHGVKPPGAGPHRYVLPAFVRKR